MGFVSDLKRGKQGEDLVSNFFATTMNCKVEDLALNKEYFAKDIDLRIIEDMGNGRSHTIEVKTDWNMITTGNVVLEMHKIKDPNKKGWFHYTEADYLAFVDIHSKLGYICRTQELKDYVLLNTECDYSKGIQYKNLGDCCCALLNHKKFKGFQTVSL